MTSPDPLLAQIQAGQPDALAQYCERQRPALLAFIERRLGAALRRKLEPEDIFQEVTAEAVRSLGNMDLQRHDLFGWLCQLVERRIVDAHRFHFAAQKRAAGREVSLQGPAAPTDSGEAGLMHLLALSMTTPSQAFSRNVREQRMYDALASLPDDQREALRLRYVENLPSKEIAARLQRTDAAVRVLLTRSLKRLQQLLGEA
ncbi:MAG: sigma-70 family RNA polymerase sigma factor [Pirellulales bacterium]